ncbi:MAG: hypothetical protein K1X67_25745 [Fimbriimonadaceae bacterium]|nr:hypothetical protein [Fimbriimonadaceae bacterium]
MRKCIVILAVAIAITGCASMEKKVIGKYQLQAVAKGENDRAATSMVNGFMGMLTFDIKEDHTVTTSLPGLNVAGAWSVSGDQITITMPDGKDKIVATISSDGRTLTPIDQDGKTTMKFVRVEE